MERDLTMKDLEVGIIELLEEEIERDSEDKETLLYELVERSMPIYYHEIYQVISTSADVAFREPENLPSEITIINIATSNIYEILQDIAYEWLEEKRKEWDLEEEI